MALASTSHSSYIGRFAPSPSGPLHLGSLVTALGSFLQAKSQGGLWLVRIDDIDPPREVTGAAKQILCSLESHGLCWDGDVLYQSDRSGAYTQAIEALQKAGLTYACNCTRKQIKSLGTYYTGTCQYKDLPKEGCALRFLNQVGTPHLEDKLLGLVSADPLATAEDFMIRRKDGLFAYHLAAVVDDIFQQVTEVVRGADLLQPTLCQLALYRAFDTSPPDFVHLPVISSAAGMKLSKQNHAQSIDLTPVKDNLMTALGLLGLRPAKALKNESVDNIIAWSVDNWRLDAIPQQQEIVL